LGSDAGSNLRNGAFNIYIGSPGGASEEFNTIRIGEQLEGGHLHRWH